jgi:hypothetical protein
MSAASSLFKPLVSRTVPRRIKGTLGRTVFKQTLDIEERR